MNARRIFLSALGASTLGGPSALLAQTQPKMLRLGTLSIVNPRTVPWVVAFDKRMEELGYIEGKNYSMDYRNAEGKAEKLEEFAQDMVRQKFDLIIAGGPEAPARAAKLATSSIPIVLIAVDYDPVAAGYAANLARPGGNFTGVFSNQIELAVKRMDLLKQAVPRLNRVAVLWDSVSASQLTAVVAAAKGMGLQVQPLEFSKYPYDYASSFAAAKRERAQAVLPLMSPLFFRSQEQITKLAIDNRLPTLAGLPNFAQAGGFISYGADLPAMYRRAAEISDKILKGARPGDLPIEQPTRFELIINMKIAKLLGIKISDQIMLRADRVIE
jgi:putative ABC transport system substrate-binding protein